MLTFRNASQAAGVCAGVSKTSTCHMMSWPKAVLQDYGLLPKGVEPNNYKVTSLCSCMHLQASASGCPLHGPGADTCTVHLETLRCIATELLLCNCTLLPECHMYELVGAIATGSKPARLSRDANTGCLVRRTRFRFDLMVVAPPPQCRVFVIEVQDRAHATATRRARDLHKFNWLDAQTIPYLAVDVSARASSVPHWVCGHLRSFLADILLY